MQISIYDTAAQAAAATADLIAVRLAQIKVLGLATGRTPQAVYDRLVEKGARGEISLAGIETFNLDEYLGLGAQDAPSFHRYMHDRLFDRLPAAKVHIPNGRAPDPAAEVLAYEAAIVAAGGIDLQLLGIGQNGHIAFNEPGSPLESRTRVVDLTASTKAANAGDFPAGQPVPDQAITMGIGTILEARTLILIATGAAKADAIRAALQGPITTDCPASAIQSHTAVHVVLDRAAAQFLT